MLNSPVIPEAPDMVCTSVLCASSSLLVSRFLVLSRRCRATPSSRSLSAERGSTKDVISRIIVWIVIVNPVTKFALDLAPIALGVEAYLAIAFRLQENGLCHPARRHRALKFVSSDPLCTWKNCDVMYTVV